jgi:hypothetical protein
LIFLHIDQELEKHDGKAISRIMAFDPVGNLLFISAIVSLLLAVQWGGTTYSYTNGKTIALFTLFGVLFVIFVAVEILQDENATGVSGILP